MNKYFLFIPKINLFIIMLTLSNCSSFVKFSPENLPQAIVNTPYSACIYIENATIEDIKNIQISTIPKDENIYVLSLQERNIHLSYEENLNHSLQIENYFQSPASPKNRKQNYNEIWLYGIPKHSGNITLILTGKTKQPNISFEKKYNLTILSNPSNQ